MVATKNTTQKKPSISKKQAQQKRTTPAQNTIKKKHNSAKKILKNIPKKSSPVVKIHAGKTIFHRAKGFVREVIPSQIFSAKSYITDTNILASIWAIFVVAIVVLLGFIYALRINDPLSMSASQGNQQPQSLQIASSVPLSADLMSGLGRVLAQVTIPPSEVLMQVNTIDDPTLFQAQNADFFANAQRGDMVLKFTNFMVLYRPSTWDIINQGAMF